MKSAILKKLQKIWNNSKIRNFQNISNTSINLGNFENTKKREFRNNLKTSEIFEYINKFLKFRNFRKIQNFEKLKSG